ncbi:MAG: sigma-70 family RNA polymerase sigma factor [Bacteroidia bacterium]|nr:sigma-70 family RNA polymerase sigma factor [Bacteroidia bacterium]
MRNETDQNYSDAEIISGIKQGGMLRQRITSYLYHRHVDFVRKGQRKYHLGEDEAVDAYGDAIIGLCNRINNEAFQSEGNLTGYLYKSFCNRCVDRVRKNSSSSIKEQVELLPNMKTEAKTTLMRLIESEDMNQILLLLDKIGGKCRQILVESEYYGFEVEELTERLGFKNANSLASQKHRCMSKLRQLLEKRKDRTI